MSKTIDKLSNSKIRYVSLSEIERFTPCEKKPIRVIALKMVDSTQVMPHLHLWGQVVFSDSGILQVNSVSNNYLVPPMHGVWIPSNIEHAAFLLENAKLLSIYFHVLDSSGGEAKNGIWTPWPNCQVFKVSPLLYELMKNLSLSENAGTVLYSATCTLIYAELDKAETLSIGVPIPAEKRLKSLCEYFLMQPTQLMTLQQLCLQVGLSLSTASRLFQQQLGIGFNQWKHQAILAKATALVAQKMPLNQIAYELGYASQSAFSVMVKKLVGIPPKAFFYQKL